MSGWIKLYRKMLDWEWYSDLNVRIVFIHSLLKANFEDSNWRGMVIKRGQFVSSVSKMSEETGLSIKQVRGALMKLEKTNEMANQGHTQFSVFTVIKYNEYQEEGKQKGKQKANEGQTKDKPKATSKEEEKEKEFKTDTPVDLFNEKFDFKKSLIDYGFDPKLVSEWMEVRKKKSAVNTQSAFNGFIREVEKANIDKNQIMQMCVEKSWRGFEAKWLENQKPDKVSTKGDLGMLGPDKYIKAKEQMRLEREAREKKKAEQGQLKIYDTDRKVD